MASPAGHNCPQCGQLRGLCGVSKVGSNSGLWCHPCSRCPRTPAATTKKQGSRSKKEQLIGRKEETASSPPPQSHLRWAALKNCAAMKQKKRFSSQDVGSEKCELFDNSSPCPWLFFSSTVCCVADRRQSIYPKKRANGEGNIRKRKDGR